jgi:hypothetical protein
MDIFDKARKALGDLAQTASTQGRVLQLQGELAQTELSLEREQREAGIAARQLWRERKFGDTDFEVIMQRITELEKRMETLRAEVNTVQQEGVPERTKRCGQCGRELAAEDEFCRGCGAQVMGR